MSEQKVLLNQNSLELHNKLGRETDERLKAETECKRMKDRMVRVEASIKDYESRLDNRDHERKQVEEMKIQEVTLLSNTVSSLKNELQLKDKEVKRYEAMVRAKNSNENEANYQTETLKSKNNSLMDENKDLKKRIREVMQTETDYQEAIIGLKVGIV
jgi:chromosome segregation ATPase